MALEKLRSYLLTPDIDWRTENYWRQKKTKPSDYGKIKASSGHEIKLFGWSEPPPAKLNDLYECVALLPSKLVLPTTYILFDDVDMPNPYDPSELCAGYRRKPERAIQFYPHAYFSNQDYKGLSGISIWKGAIIHEFTHNQDFYPEIMEAWIQEFGWVRLNQSREVTASDGSCIRIEYECRQPERLVTRYAGYKPSEDLSESMVAALFDPNRLDPDKLDFIKQYFGV